MWLFTDFGFFSVVEDKNSHRKDYLVVRARSYSDLVSLVDLYGITLRVTRSDIKVTPNADYHCRVFVDREAWAATLGDITRDIDYSNFKDAVHQKMGYDRANTYMDVWDVMYKLQKRILKKLSLGGLNNTVIPTYSTDIETVSNTSQENKTNDSQE